MTWAFAYGGAKPQRGKGSFERGGKIPVVTLLSDGYQFVRTVEPGRAARRVERGDAEWVTMPGVTPDPKYGTLRMLTPRHGGTSPRHDVLLVLAADGLPLMKLTERDRIAVRRRLSQSDPRALDLGGCVLLSRTADAALREEVIVALSAVAADGVARFARLRSVVQEVMTRAGAERSSDLSQQDLSRIATLLSGELRQDLSIADVMVEIQKMGRLLGPDRAQIRELAAEVQHLTLRPRQRPQEDAGPSFVLENGSHRAGRGGGRQSLEAAQAHAAAAGQ